MAAFGQRVVGRDPYSDVDCEIEQVSSDVGRIWRRRWPWLRRCAFNRGRGAEDVACRGQAEAGRACSAQRTRPGAGSLCRALVFKGLICSSSLATLFGSDAVVMVTPEPTVKFRVFVAELPAFALSVAVAATDTAPAAVGVPITCPAALSDSPAAPAPVTVPVQVYVPAPPVAESV